MQSSYYSRYNYSFHSSGYSFSFSLKVLGVRAIVLGFRVRVRVKVRIRIRGLGDQNYEVGFETIGTVTQNYANFAYSGYFSNRDRANSTKCNVGNGAGGFESAGVPMTSQLFF